LVYAFRWRNIRRTMCGSGPTRRTAIVVGQLIPELASVSGIEIVGPLPSDIQTYIVLTGGVGTNAKDKAAAQEK